MYRGHQPTLSRKREIPTGPKGACSACANPATAALFFIRKPRKVRFIAAAHRREEACTVQIAAE